MPTMPTNMQDKPVKERKVKTKREEKLEKVQTEWQATPAPEAAMPPTKAKRAPRKTTRKKQVAPPSAEVATAKPHKRTRTEEPIFALDIGTRSVIGIVAERAEDGAMHILATKRKEHKTRAMLDGQIHDVPQVADVIRQVKNALVEEVGPLKEASVAAAGRALYTMTAEAETEIAGVIDEEAQRALDFAGVQAAQAKLISSKTLEDPSHYYCVGYSTIQYTLDGIPLKSLVGQRGSVAKASVIATFLPRQVIDSMRSALKDVQLDMRALTLEPIAAINVLIPPTMRHLNLVLVDIGAGTSDVAVTKEGAIIAYGMVPLAGDEITEAISQRYLLDFNVAERVKRDASAGKNVSFSDILGVPYDLKPADVIEPILPSIQNLATAIAKQILGLNGNSPQAVMLVGGGSQTPGLAAMVAKALSIPDSRVAVRSPQAVDGLEDIPEELRHPDAVTPLGILKIASTNALHFLTVTVNGEETNLFNFRKLTVSDALLNAGVQLRRFNGKPGLGLALTVNGEHRFFRGTLPTMAAVKLDGETSSLDAVVKEGSQIEIQAGKDGTAPIIHLDDVLAPSMAFKITVNGEEKLLEEARLVNGKPVEGDIELKDGDVVESQTPRTVGEALRLAGFSPTGRRMNYTLNGEAAQYVLSPEITQNDRPATLSLPIAEGDRLEYIEPEEPKLADVLDINHLQASVQIHYQGKEYDIPSASLYLTVNGRKASPGTFLEEGADVRYKIETRKATTVNEALLAVGFQPPVATSRVSVTILVNHHPVIFTDPIKNGDQLDIIIRPLDTPPPKTPASTPSTNANSVQSNAHTSSTTNEAPSQPATSHVSGGWERFVKPV